MVLLPIYFDFGHPEGEKESQTWPKSAKYFFHKNANPSKNFQAMFLFARVPLSENFGNIRPYLGVIVRAQKPPKKGNLVDAESVRKHF